MKKYKKMTVGEFKSQLSDVIAAVQAGERIVVTYGKKKKVVGYFVPELPEPGTKRKLGILEGKAKAVFRPDFKITEEEFLGE